MYHLLYKIKTISILGIFILIGYSANAQTINVDSIKRIYTKNKKIDKQKIDVSNDLAYAIYWKESEEALRYAEEAYEWAKKIGYDEGIANSLWIKGVIHIRIDRKKALNLFEEGYELAEQSDYKIGMCRTQIGITSLYTDFG